jgi:hypothetical protein
MNLTRRFFQTTNQTVDRQSRFWYLKVQVEFQCDLAQRIALLSLGLPTQR